MKNLIVAKFGGTSMGNAQSIRQVAEIIKGYNSIVAVVSATSGTTDQLIELAEKALAGENWEESFQNIKSICVHCSTQLVQCLLFDLMLLIKICLY